jgi:hypothetical protein
MLQEQRLLADSLSFGIRKMGAILSARFKKSTYEIPFVRSATTIRDPFGAANKLERDCEWSRLAPKLRPDPPLRRRPCLDMSSGTWS